jgi:ABC-type lipoprotein export system ATPase subunit
MSIQIITNYADAITSAYGLDNNQAKTVVYWSIATHAIEKQLIVPILVITGPFSSGKSTLISIIRQICFQPRPIDGEISKAVLRDKLEANTTTLIEEADKVDSSHILSFKQAQIPF